MPRNIDLSAYLAKRGFTFDTDKIDNLARVSDEKRAAFAAYERQATQNQLDRGLAEAALAKSFVGSIGLDPESTLGIAANTLAGVGVGATRFAGQVGSSLHTLQANQLAQTLDDRVLAADGRARRGEATREDLQLLYSPAAKNPGEVFGPEGETNQERINRVRDSLRSAGQVREAMDFGEVQYQGAKRGLEEQLKAEAGDSLKSIGQGWDKLTGGDWWEGAKEIASGIPGAAAAIPSAAVDNKQGALDYVAENLVNTLGAFAGPAGMALTNGAYGLDLYGQGMEAWLKNNGGDLAPQGERNSMAGKAIAATAAELVGDKIMVGAGKVASLGRKAAGDAAEAGAEITREAAKKSLLGSLAGAAKAVTNSMPGRITLATLQGAAGEFPTEAFQTVMENSIVGKDTSLEEAYVGGSIGAIVGGAMSGGMRTLGETGTKAAASIEKRAQEAANAALVEVAIRDKNPQPFMSPDSPIYDPLKAVSVLHGLAKEAGVTPEQRNDYFTQAMSVTGGLDARMKKAKGVDEQKRLKAEEDQLFEQLGAFRADRDQLNARDALAAAAAPAAAPAPGVPGSTAAAAPAGQVDTISRDAVSAELFPPGTPFNGEQLATELGNRIKTALDAGSTVEILDDKGAVVAPVTAMTPEGEPLDAAGKAYPLDGAFRVTPKAGAAAAAAPAAPGAAPAPAPQDLDADLADAAGPDAAKASAAVKRIFNLSMRAPATLTPQQAQQLTAVANNQANGLTDPQRQLLRVMSAQRMEENRLKSQKDVNNEVLFGNRALGQLGISNYRERFQLAQETGNLGLMDRQVTGLQAFLRSHQGKLAAARQALDQAMNLPGRLGVWVLRNRDGSWVTKPVPNNLSENQADGIARENGGLRIHRGSTSFVEQRVATEVRALDLAVQELSALRSMAVGTVDAPSAAPASQQGQPAQPPAAGVPPAAAAPAPAPAAPSPAPAAAPTAVSAPAPAAKAPAPAPVTPQQKAVIDTVAESGRALQDQASKEVAPVTEAFLSENADVGTLVALLGVELQFGDYDQAPTEQMIRRAQNQVLGMYREVLADPSAIERTRADLALALSWLMSQPGDNTAREERARKSATKYGGGNPNAHLLVQLVEELGEMASEVAPTQANAAQAEIQKRALKVLRFGPDTVIKQDGPYKGMTNQQAYEAAVVKAVGPVDADDEVDEVDAQDTQDATEATPPDSPAHQGEARLPYEAALRMDRTHGWASDYMGALKPTGYIFREALASMKQDPLLARWFAGVFEGDPATLHRELYARIHALYAVQPELMNAHLAQTFQAFDTRYGVEAQEEEAVDEAVDGEVPGYDPEGSEAPGEESADAAAGSAGQEVVEDDPTQDQGLLTVFSRRIERGKMTMQELWNAVDDQGRAIFNPIAQFFSQQSSNPLYKTRRPLVAVADFFGRLANTEAKDRFAWLEKMNLLEKRDFEPDSDEQLARGMALSSLADHVARWVPVINDHLANWTGHKDFKQRDMLQYLLEQDEQGLYVEGNVAGAIAAAAYSYVASQANSLKYLRPQDIATMHGRDKDVIPAQEGINVLRSWHHIEGKLISDLGEAAAQMLGITTEKDAPTDMLPRLKSALGTHAMMLLERQGYLQRGQIEAKVVEGWFGDNAATQTGEESGEEGEADKHAGEKVVKYVRFNPGEHRQADNQPMFERKLFNRAAAGIKRIKDANRGSQGVVDRLMGTEKAPRIADTQPRDFTQTRAKGSRQRIPKRLARVQQAMQQMQHKVIPDMLTLFLGMGQDGLLVAAGARELDERKVSARHWDAVEAQNGNLKLQLDLMLEMWGFKESLSDMLPGEIAEKVKKALGGTWYITTQVWKNFRVGVTTQSLNQQTSKIHRTMMYREGWGLTLPTAGELDEDQQALVDEFRLSAFMNLGFKTDAQPNAKSLAMLDAWLADRPQLRQAIEVVKDGVVHKKDVWTPENIALVGEAAAEAEGMLSLQAMVALAKFEAAQEADEASVEVHMLVGADGKTNGPILTHLALGAAADLDGMYVLLNRGGMYSLAEGQASHYSEWKDRLDEAGNKARDLYEQLAHGVLTLVQSRILPRKEIIKLWKERKRLADAGQADAAKKVAEQASKAITPEAFNALQVITGDLLKDGKMTSAARNQVKTPVTMFGFGSSLPGSVQNMAQDFVEGVFTTFEKLAAKPAGAKTARDVLQAMNVLMEFAAGKEWDDQHAFDVDMGVEAALKLKLTDQQEVMLYHAFHKAMGQATAETMETQFAVFIERRRALNKSIGAAFQTYKTAYDAARAALVDKLIADGQIAWRATYTTVTGADGKKTRIEQRYPLHDLTQQQENGLRKSLSDLLPQVNTAQSLEEGDISAGLFMAKQSKTQSKNELHSSKVQLGNTMEWVEGEQGEQLRKPLKHIESRAIVPQQVQPGVGGTAYTIHSSDSAGMHNAIEAVLEEDLAEAQQAAPAPAEGQEAAEIAPGSVPGANPLNVHDEASSSAAHIARVAKALNKSIAEVFLHYSPAREALKTMERQIIGLAARIKEGSLPATLAAQLRQDWTSSYNYKMPAMLHIEPEYALGFIARMTARNAYQADRLRLATYAKMAVMDQYVWEGGEFRPDDAFRAQAVEQLVQVELTGENPSVEFQEAVDFLQSVAEGVDPKDIDFKAWLDENRGENTDDNQRPPKPRTAAQLGVPGTVAPAVIDALAPSVPAVAELQAAMRQGKDLTAALRGLNDQARAEAIQALANAGAQLDPAQFNPWGEIGAPAIPGNATLTAFLAQHAGGEGVTVGQLAPVLAEVLRHDSRRGPFQKFNLLLLGRLVKLAPANVRVRYVTPTTPAASVVARPQDRSRGWFASDGANRDEIYVLSNDFVHSAIEPELLLHEMTHAVLAQIVAAAQDEITAAKGKPARLSEAAQLVQELEGLREKAQTFIAAHPGLQAQFEDATGDVQELIAWGMTNQAFQQQVLAKIQVSERTNRPGDGNRLVNGMRAFVQRLVGLLFQRTDKAGHAQAFDGLTVLVSNVSGLMAEAAGLKAPTQRTAASQAPVPPAPNEEPQEQPAHGREQVQLHQQVSAAIEGKLDVADRREVAEAYGHKRWNQHTRTRFLDDVLDFINGQVGRLAPAVRRAAQKVAAAVLAVAFVFNPYTVSDTQAYVAFQPVPVEQATARKAEPDQAAVDAAVEAAGAAPELDAAVAARMSPAGQQAYRALMAGLGRQLRERDKLLVMVDKPQARIFVFQPDGQLVVDQKVLLGRALGDYYVGDNDNPKNRITPAGLFRLGLRDARRGGYEKKTAGEYDFQRVFVLDKAIEGEYSVTMLHSIWLKESDAAQRRAAIRSDSAKDSRYSFGCINVDTKTYGALLEQHQARMDGAMMFVVPDNQAKVQEFLHTPTDRDGLQRHSVPQPDNASTASVKRALNLSQRAAGPVRYTTRSLFEALGATTPPGARSVTPEFAGKLGNVIDQIVNALHGPYSQFKAANMATNAQAALDVWDRVQRGGEAPFVSIIPAHLALSAQEAFVVESVEATLRSALENNESRTAIPYAELARLYKEARERLKPADFADPATYDFIFGIVPTPNAGGRSDYLSRFAALGLGHQEFNRLLAFATAGQKASPADLTFEGRLRRVFEAVLTWFHGKVTNTFAGEPASQQLTKLVGQLVGIEAKKRARLARPASQASAIAGIDQAAQKAAKALRKGVAGVAGARIVRQARLGVVRGAGAVVRTVANEQVEAAMELMTKARDAAMQKRQGLLAGLLTEFRGIPQAIATLGRGVKEIEKERERLIQAHMKVVMDAFQDGGVKLSPEQKAGLSQVLLRSGAEVLLGDFDMAGIEQLLTDRKALQAAIDARVRELVPHRDYFLYFVGQAKTLGYYRATGRVKDLHMMMNARNIALMSSTEHEGRLPADQLDRVTRVIEQLVALYAIKEVDPKRLVGARQVLASENARTDGGNGVEFLLLDHRRLLAESRDKLFQGTESMAQHGYTPEVFNHHTAMAVPRNDEEKQALLEQAYVPGEMLDLDPDDPNQDHTPQLFFLKDYGQLPRASGVMSLRGQATKGSKLYGGKNDFFDPDALQNMIDTLAMHQARDPKIQKLFTKPLSWEPSMAPGTYMAPVLHRNGAVVGQRYLMSERTKDEALERDNRPEALLGWLAGSTFDKAATPDHNRDVVMALREIYNDQYHLKPKSFARIAADSDDLDMRELYRLMPDVTQQLVRSVWGKDGMFVPYELLDAVFGYRKLSISQAFDKDRDGAELNFAEKALVRGTEHALYHGALAFSKMTPAEARIYSKRGAVYWRRAEKAWQEIVKEMKDLIVVKSGVVLLGNVKSNLTFLAMAGVPMGSMAYHHKVAAKAGLQYQRDREALASLEIRLAAGYTQGNEAQIRAEIAELQDSIARNPALELIQGGLMPTIVEDLDTETDVYSYRSQFVRKVDQYAQKVNPSVLKVAKYTYMTHDTPLYKVMSQATQLSDFMARYTLYQHLTTRKVNPLSKEDALHEASEAFVNYDRAMQRQIQYADDSGFFMFTKYFLRIQRVLVKLAKEHPARVLTGLLLSRYFDSLETVFDSHWIHHVPSNPVEAGALGYPFALDELATVRPAMALLR